MQHPQHLVHPDHPDGRQVERDLARLDRGLPTTGQEWPVGMLAAAIRRLWFMAPIDMSGLLADADYRELLWELQRRPEIVRDAVDQLLSHFYDHIQGGGGCPVCLCDSLEVVEDTGNITVCRNCGWAE